MSSDSRRSASDERSGGFGAGAGFCRSEKLASEPELEMTQGGVKSSGTSDILLNGLEHRYNKRDVK